jgi:hypothetical protein
MKGLYIRVFVFRNSCRQQDNSAEPMTLPCSNRGNMSGKSSHVFRELALSRTGRVAKDCADDIGGEGDETIKDIVHTRVVCCNLR